jgi:hypothetical protein
MIYNFKEDQLNLTCINLSDEIKRGEPLLNYDEITILNSSILNIKGSSNLLIASRGWYGNIRSWDGINFVILSVFNNKLKKIKQKILDIDETILNKNLLQRKLLKFKKFEEGKFVIHEDRSGRLGGPEDPRLFYYNDDIYIMVNQLNSNNKYSKPPRHMYISKIDLDKLHYDTNKTNLCEALSTSFEKNWGSFMHKNKLHMLYSINPLKIYEVDKKFKCKMLCNIEDKIFKKIEESYPELDFHLRNSTNLIELKKNEYLGMGHGVLDFKGNTDINKYLIPSLNDSKYSKIDKRYFKLFFKLYTGFFFILNLKKKEVTYISPFFQLPNYESKQELIFFPTSIFLDDDDFVNISYNVGDNRSYYVKLHLNLIKLSLYDKNNIDFQVNYNINPNYYLELIRNIRKLLGYSIARSDYYKFKDVRITIGSKHKLKKTKKKKRTKKKY